MTDELLIERDGFIVTLTLNRPHAANALGVTLLRALRDATRTLAADETARAVVVTGMGERAFCAGADLKERAGMTPDEVRETVTTIRDTMRAIAMLPIPVIAAINGAALGGGTELALACDIRFAASTAKLGLTETGLGIIPGGGGTQRLARLIGPGRAMEMIATARILDAEEAARIGLVSAVYSPESVRAHALACAQRIAANAPVAVRAAKEAVMRGLDLTLDEGLELETRLYERTVHTTDRLEGLAAFREKRAPVYRGE